MIDEDKVDEILERARALGTDYDVIADIIDLISEVRRLDVRADLRAAEQRTKVGQAAVESETS